MNKIINCIKTNKIKSLIGLGVILSLLVVVISFSFANPDPNYSFIYNSVGTNNNYENNDGGSFSLNKKIEWTSLNKLKVTLTVNSKPVINSNNNDILLVVDTSSFLDNDMLTDLKQSLTSSVSVINSTDSTSRIGIISFSNNYTKYDFTNDLSTIESNISNLSIGGGRSYYQAFNGIDDILTNRDTNRGLRVIFITTGISNLNKSGDLYKYEQINDKYNLDINCIYYLTNKVLDQPHNYFSRKIISNKNNLEVNIESLGIDYKAYNNFAITDHYDTSKYSLVGTISDYDGSSHYTNYGELVVNTTGEIEWVMENSDDRPFYTGTTAKLEYELNYTGETGNYALNNTDIVVSKTLDQTTSNFTITDSLVTGNSYNVTYDSNAPSGCTPSGSFGSSHKDVYEVVQHPADPTCSGYKFAGWKVVTEGVKKSDNGFIMPPKNVEVKATWSKVSIVKSMSGDVKEVPKAYDLFKEEAEKTNGVIKDYDTFFAGQGFSHQDAYDGSGDKKIYFFRYKNSGDDTKINNMNNVIFANHCWQMLRTTDTGGIKMIYNGEPEVGETGHEECQTTRGGHIGYNAANSGDTLTIASGTVYYGSDYTYDSTNNVFSLAGTITSSSSWSSDYNNLIGKYTCNSTSSNGTCQTLYLIESYKSNTVANVLKLEFIATATGVYSQFGKVPFNRLYTSPADVGYMYNARYTYLSKSLGTTSYYFGSDYSYDYNTLTGEYEYSLTGEVLKDYTGDITTTHYTCWKTTAGGTCSQLSYVYYHSTKNKTMYYINLSNNRTVNSYLDEMLNNDNVNRYDSTMKLAVDKWYEHYILPYPEFTSKLENAVFCNDRSISNLGGWSPTGTQNVYLQFKNYIVDNNLNCSNLTDRFSADTNNTKAYLTYPVGLMSSTEMNLLNNANLRKTGVNYWLVSPSFFGDYFALGRYVNSTGSISGSNVYNSSGVRPSVSLATGTKFTSGDGSMSEPYRLD